MARPRAVLGEGTDVHRRGLLPTLRGRAVVGVEGLDPVHTARLFG